MGCLQINSANRESATKIICLIWGPSANVTICGFAICGPNPFVISGLKTSVSAQIHTFLLTNIEYEALIKNLYRIPKSWKRRLLKLFQQDLCGILQKFADLSLNFSDLRTGILKKFADLRTHVALNNKFACLPLIIGMMYLLSVRCLLLKKIVSYLSNSERKQKHKIYTMTAC